ncbi:hypothetical protein Q7P37_000262 [Cladosporium fusiforme]
MFANTDRRLLLKLAQPPVMQRISMSGTVEKQIVSPAAEECKIQMIGLAVDRFFDRYEDTVLHTDHSLLCWLRSQYFGKAYKDPSELPGRNATRKRCRGLWKNMIFFCIRAHLARAQDVNGVAWGIPFSASAWSAIEDLWKVVSGGLDVSLDEWPEQRRLQHHDHGLGEFVSAPDDDEYSETDDLDESSSDSEESDDENTHLSNIGTVAGSPATQTSGGVDSDECGAVSQPQSALGTATKSSTAIPPPNDLFLDFVAKRAWDRARRRDVRAPEELHIQAISNHTQCRTDDSSSVKWEDGSLTMTEFRALGHHALRLVQGTIDALMGKFRPALNLSLLRDRISEHKHGYSFVQEPKNDISSAYLNFANRICADPESGLMTRKGWNMRSVRQFLRKEEMLVEQIMLMMCLRGQKGDKPRFQVARYLPKSDSLDLATYLVYVRPLTEMTYRSSFGTDIERKLLFSSLQEPEKLWRADRLTSALKKLTMDVPGLEIGVRVYRQLSIAVTERHLTHISSPFNRYDDKSSNAKIEVAFAWQSGHRILQRGISYASTPLSRTFCSHHYSECTSGLLESGNVSLTEGLTIMTLQSRQHWNLGNIINVVKLSENGYVQVPQRLERRKPIGTKRKSEAK